MQTTSWHVSTARTMSFSRCTPDPREGRWCRVGAMGAAPPPPPPAVHTGQCPPERQFSPWVRYVLPESARRPLDQEGQTRPKRQRLPTQAALGNERHDFMRNIASAGVGGLPGGRSTPCEQRDNCCTHLKKTFPFPVASHMRCKRAYTHKYQPHASLAVKAASPHGRSPSIRSR